MESKSIKQQIKDCYQQLSPVCQKVARFVIDNYQQTMLLGSVELAEAANVSHTAVIRFAKALGFSGFLEYKNQLKKEYITTQKVYTSLKSMQMGSKGGYVAVRAKADTYQTTKSGRRYAVGYVTNAIEGGHRHGGRRGSTKPGYRYRPRYHTPAVPGRWFYDQVRQELPDMAETEIRQLLDYIADGLEGQL